MDNTHQQQRFRRRRESRRGVVTVELALVVSLVFLPLFLGMMEASRLYDAHNELSSAIRSGARLACMDRNGIVEEGQSTNDKVIKDIRVILNANGLPGDESNVYISHPDCPEYTFDLDNPANDLELFRVQVDVPYSALNPYCPPNFDDIAFSSSIVFRNAKSSIVQ